MAVSCGKGTEIDQINQKNEHSLAPRCVILILGMHIVTHTRIFSPQHSWVLVRAFGVVREGGDLRCCGDVGLCVLHD
jgi:hypothetical protein